MTLNTAREVMSSSAINLLLETGDYGLVGAWPVLWAPHGCRGGVAAPLCPAWPPWGRGRSPGPRMAAVGAWPLPWAPHGRRGDAAAPLVPVCQPWGRARSPCPRLAAVGARPLSRAPSGCRGGVAGLLGPVCALETVQQADLELDVEPSKTVRVADREDVCQFIRNGLTGQVRTFP